VKKSKISQNFFTLVSGLAIMTIFNANLLNWQTIIQHFSETYFSYKDIQSMLQNYVEILKDRVYG